MNKIYLCGLSGCGKSSLGRWLATEKGLTFIDLDQYIESKLEMTINDIFNHHGEAYFRQQEELALIEVAKSDAQIIALGGGTLISTTSQQIVKNAEVIFIDRDVENILTTLDASNRPLLQHNSLHLYQQYQERYHLYLALATIHLINNGNIDQIKAQLLAIDLKKE